MDLQKAVNGMLDARSQLRSSKGVADAGFISEQMQRLTQYTGAVEEHLAEYEEQLEIQEMDIFNGWLKDGKSINQAELLAKQEVGQIKGQIAKLKRYVNSSWQIVGVAQSRFNHLQKQGTGQV
jgi:septation ring formation regulator EzrA